MIMAEYSRFLQTLNAEEIPADVRKIANIVSDNIDALIPLTTTHGQRVKKIVELAQANWTTASSDIQPAPEQVANQSAPFVLLKSLGVGPFRGFTRQETFDLCSQLVLIYGPNGTGKSSFCEALEFALLGHVAEAECKRFRNQHEYLKNAHTNNFSPPALLGQNSQGNEVSVSANESLFRFCFVEKNRIDNFSRIAAQAPARQTELISSLFGLDAFAEFVGNFTDAMDGKYIDIQGVKSIELAKDGESLTGYQQQLETSIPEDFQRIENDETVLASEYREGCSYHQMVTELNGTDTNCGLIKHLDKEIHKELPVMSNLSVADLADIKQFVETSIGSLKSKNEELLAASQQVSFKQLYEAVIRLKDVAAEQCPACKTPIPQVSIDPFKHAEAELATLSHLGEVQDAVEILEDDIGTSLAKLSIFTDSCCTRLTDNNPLSAFSTSNHSIDWWHSLHTVTEGQDTPWSYLEGQVTQLEDEDHDIERKIAERTVKQEQLTHLRTLAERSAILQGRREASERSKRSAEDAIAAFNALNAQLIQAAADEMAAVSQNKSIVSSYNSFVNMLNAYNDSLPALLVADLGDKVVQLYNAFNRNDAEQEQLASIRLPMNQNQRLDISFQRAPETYFDALHVLSEGHIRCIGLAIVTAKNITEDCPLLIFDDPVNAIDDEHRESIRRTLFEDSLFVGKQIILACHGEEFFKDIQNLLSADRAKCAKTVAFLPRHGDTDIHIDHNCSPRNYISAARSHYENSEIREALAKSRQALESLTKQKVWPYVSRYGDGNLSIKLRSATATIVLRNLTDQLKSKISKPDFTHQNKMAVLTPIESLLGVSGESREWRYLNKGTHEEADRAEFDRQTVNEIVSALEQLDAALG